MHRDKKLGLALGILLIGAVGAFFFRNETGHPAEIPELENTQAIDEQIREQDGSLPLRQPLEPDQIDRLPLGLGDAIAERHDGVAVSALERRGFAELLERAEKLLWERGGKAGGFGGGRRGASLAAQGG